MISAYHAKYYAHELTRRHAADGVDRLSQSLFDASVDLNPHQIEAALFALRNPLQEGVLLADEVGLGKTIEAALVVCQYWAERRRRLLVICPASLRKQWAQELHDKFAVPTTVVDAVSLRKQSAGDMLATLQRLVGKAVVIMSYQFAARLEAELRAVPWDVVVIDEAHKLRNAHRASNRTGQALKRALQGRKKLLLTATPLQNSLMELYGLSTLIDEHLFGDETAFRKQFMNSGTGLDELRERLASFAKRTLRRDVLEYIQYTERKALTQPFNPTDDEQALYERISAFLQKEDSYALPKQQRHLTGLILRKLLASSSHAVAATLVTIRKRLQGLLAADGPRDDGSELIEQLIVEDDLEQDYLEEEAGEDEDATRHAEPSPADDTKPGSGNDANAVWAAITAEIEELTAFINAAQALQTDTKAQALLKALNLGFGKMAELRAPRKAIIFTESKRTQEYGKRLLPMLAGQLTAEFGKGFDERNLRHMRAFFQAFPIWDAVRSELSWTHYRLLTRVAKEEARQWYMHEAAEQNWSSRALERQMSTLFYERLLLSQDKAAVATEAQQKLAALEQSPRAFVRDPVMLEFLCLPGSGKLLEAGLEQGLIDKLQAFLLELGKGFAFVARQQRVSTESKDFYIDLVFYNYLLKCFVLIDLKTSELTHQDIGQMDMYPLLALEDKDAVPLKLRPLAFDAPSEWEFVRDLEAFYNSGEGKEAIGPRSLYLLRNADREEKGLGFALAGNFYPDFLLWLVHEPSGKQWLTFVDPKGLRNLDLSHPKLGLYKEVKTLQATLATLAAQAKAGEAPLVLNAFVLSPTKFTDLLNVGDPTRKADLESRNVLFMEDGPGTYLTKMFQALT